jgi:hypothetical protein
MDAGMVTAGAPARAELAERTAWPDWLMDRLDALPGPRWLAILIILLVVAAIGHLCRWADGSMAVGELSIIRLLEGSFGLLFLVAMRELDGVALRALARLRPVIQADDESVARLGSRLTRTPWQAASVAAVLGAGAGLTSLLSQPAAYDLGPDNSQLTWAYECTLAVASAAAGLAFVTHALNQLRIVSRIHRSLVRVQLFHLEPLYAFASLTSRTGLTLIAVLLFGVGTVTLTSGGRFVLSGVDVVMVLAFLGLAVVSFVGPLVGLHARIVEEKDRQLAAANATLEAVIAEVDRRVAAGAYDGMSVANDALAAARSGLSAVSSISTWPWRPETFRGFVSALVIPVVVWMITALLANVIGR